MRHNLLESIANPGLIPSVGESLIVEPLESLFVERSLGVIQAEGDLKVLRVCAESSLGEVRVRDFKAILLAILRRFWNLESQQNRGLL